ncbi:hypothetical protein [Bacillus xiapuensis]|uniref:hypothetical protein n=1 Tax=Bacillus xiapuensis TaxID=2014075 RepID=UPI000C245563|nr:hypothetical protein [Bacillus xiapuensis]
MDHTNASWKNENVISQLRNSVESVSMAVGQAQSHPSEQLIEQARNLIDRTNHAAYNALLNTRHPAPVHELLRQLTQEKEKLQTLSPAKD